MEDKKHILLVDDDESLLKVVGTMLKGEGYKISTAFDGEEAIELLKKNSYDLVLLDIVMPKVDGFGVLKFVKETPLNVKIVVLTAYSTLKLAVESKQMGARDFVAKPPSRDDLLNTIKDVLAN
jgi:DNA-binding NtrC family response regulator